MTPQDFIQKWGPGGPAHGLNEEQGAQSHFLDLCELLAVPKPGSQDGYLFEEKNSLIGGRTGYADVFRRGAFAWENKSPGKNLDAALKQLLSYSLALSNPPILVVCDRLTIRIHTQFTGHPTETHTVLLLELDQPEKLALLRRIWLDPESFRPKKTSRDITEAAAKSFATLADGLRRRKLGSDPDFAKQNSGSDPNLSYADEVAHFLTQCLFCFFAEDVGLLPDRMFEGLVNNRKLTSDKLGDGLRNLFTVMRDGGLYGNEDIPWFNGGLFKKIKVPTLTVLDTTELRNAAALNWSAIDVSIFGTLFERGLDPSKRSQLGAHYTDPATIQRIIEPVLQRPLLQIWEHAAQEIRGLMAKSSKKKRAAYSAFGSHYKASPGDASFQKAERLFYDWLDQLKNYRVLDPACGSGNFLFLGLKALKDIEHKSHLDAAAMGLDREADLVTGPHNMLGIELNEYAAELARVTVWIGELQWRLMHGYEFKTNPVLEPLDHIECRDALLSFGEVAIGGVAVRGDGSEAQAGQMPGAHTLRFLKSPPTSAPPAPPSFAGSGDGGQEESGNRGATGRSDEKGHGDATGREEEKGSDHDFAKRNSCSDPLSSGVSEATWPKASVVIGNPPFLGDRKMIRELGEDYTFTLRRVYDGRVPGGADLVCYWFEKARTAIEKSGLGAAGLVATNSIRGGANRKVLDAISQSTRIYEAWGDQEWVNDGAAVRVSLVAFGHATQDAVLDGVSVSAIAADLSAQDVTGTSDLTTAVKLIENSGASFIGTQKNGPFDITGEIARNWLEQPNPNGLSSAAVLRPWVNGISVTRRAQDLWVIDFDKMSESEACLFEHPFSHAVREVKPTRMELRRDWHRLHWWCHGDPRPAMKVALRNIPRQIISPRVSKHRVFSWFSNSVLPDSAVVAIARADDTTFGVLHSRFHELWSLKMCTWMGKGNDPRYTPTTCFETFPFPKALTPADTAHQRTETLDNGAVIPTDLSGRPTEVRMGRMSGAILKSEAYEPPASAPSSPVAQSANELASAERMSPRQAAEQIAKAAKRLNDLRDSWLNPPEWTQRVPEVIPLGMDTSPYPDRILPKNGHEKELAERTLTKLYNQCPAWLDAAHKDLDAAVAAAYGWTDYTADMPDEEILKRLLALNLERASDATK
jgi:hypothetical protein